VAFQLSESEIVHIIMRLNEDADSDGGIVEGTNEDVDKCISLTE
jgi:hypothetical protein